MTPNATSLRINSTCAAQMLAHVDRVFPEECVGFLAGIGTDVSLVVPFPNSAGLRSFFVEPYDQYLAEQRIKEDGLELIAIYHSHPHGCCCMSETDLHFAKRWDCIQVVIAISVQDRYSTQVKAYRPLLAHNPTEIAIVIR